jgi:hypothetical protein
LNGSVRVFFLERRCLNRAPFVVGMSETGTSPTSGNV